MPELPEVETTRLGLAPHLIGQKITAIESRVPKLRWMIDSAALLQLIDRKIVAIDRRGKYLLIKTDDAEKVLLLHLGMSGSLRLTSPNIPLKKHDHFLLTLDNQQQMRLHDPRRFGHVEVINSYQPHPLLASLGVEPLSDAFTAQYLYQSTRNRRCSIKAHIMNQKIVVGVGNIYATEALFLAGIRPQRPAHKITKNEAEKLTIHIKNELTRAIAIGGTTLRDFIHPDGTNGYFQQTLKVYGRVDEPCVNCGGLIKNIVITNRASAYCPNCQK